MTSRIFIVSLGIPGAFWRAVFVAALALIAFALFRYSKSLPKLSKTNRQVLIALRGIALVLLACVFSGLQISYDRHLPLRIFIHRASSGSEDQGAKGGAEADATKGVIASLKSRNVEVVEPGDIIDADSGFPVGSIFVTYGALRAEDASAEIQRAQIESGGGPVFVVSDITTVSGPRVSIEGITATERPIPGVPLILRCMVHAVNMGGRETLVTVSDDAQVRTSARVRWMAEDERQALSLEVVPKLAGWINYLVRAEGAGSEDPLTLSRPLTIFVEERRTRILFLESEPTWESKFIRRALDKSGLFDVDYFAQVSRAALAGAKVKTSGELNDSTPTNDRASPDSNLRAALSSASKLNAYDCVFVGIATDAMLSTSEATRLIEWVDRRGGGLIILGGNSFAGSIVGPKGKLGVLMPADIDSRSFRSDIQTLARRSPVEATKSREAIILTPTSAGKVGPLRGFSNALQGSPSPAPLSGEGFRFGILRPASTVLAVRGQPNVQENTEGGEPLIVSMRFGAGRVIVFGPADSWRMRTGESDNELETASPFASLWEGMALSAGSTARPAVEIAMSDESPESASEVTSQIRVRDESYGPIRIEKLRGRIQQLNEGGADTSITAPLPDVPFFPDPEDSSIWRARFTAPAPGHYSLQVDYSINKKSGTTEKRFGSIVASQVEPGATRDALRRVSRETGGDLYSASALNILGDRIAALPGANRYVRHTTELRSWWPLALLIPLLLSVEWLIERLRATGVRDSVNVL